MIVFSPIDPIQLYEFWAAYHPNKADGFAAYNLSSLDTRFPLLNGLIPDSRYMSEQAILNDTSPLFDQEYYRYILEGPGFIPFMQIVSAEYLHGNFINFIEVELSPYRDSITESLIKLLNIRYGLIPNVVNSFDDMNNINTDNSFSIIGLNVVGEDMIRYSSMVKTEVSGEPIE